MNNKIIAAGVVVALCAVALTGVGYAYTATFENGDNTISSDAQYIVISKESTAVAAATITVSNIELIVPFDSETKKPLNGNTYTTTYSPGVKNGVDGWTQVGVSTEYTKVIQETVTLKVDTKNAGTPTGNFSVQVTPGTVTPTAGSGIESIAVSVSKINGTDLVDGKGSFTGLSTDEVSVTILLNITITVDKSTSLSSPPVELNNVKFDMTYVIVRSA